MSPANVTTGRPDEPQRRRMAAADAVAGKRADRNAQSDDDVSVAILAGGRGNRLRPISDVLPKVLLPLGDGTVLDHLLGKIAHTRVTDVHLLLGHQAALIDAYLRVQRGQHPELTVTLHVDTGDLGTAGPLRAVNGGPGPWLVINGDVASDVLLCDVLRAHEESGADVTVVGVDHLVEIPFGVFSLDGGGRVRAITEKPVVQNVVSAGVNVLGARARERLTQSGSLDMTDLITRCIRDGLEVRPYLTRCAWFDVGTMPDYVAAMKAWSDRSRNRTGDES